MRRGIYRAIGINRKGKYFAFLLVDQPIRFEGRFDGRFLFLRDIRLCLQNLKWNQATQEQDSSSVHVVAGRRGLADGSIEIKICFDSLALYVYSGDSMRLALPAHNYPRIPAHAVFFYTDWQHGPTRKFRGGLLAESTFWHLHDTHHLRLNACYTIQPDAVPFQF
jgi:hypothetical protein